MNHATRITVSILGLYAGLLGAVHGYFEILQGNLAPNGVAIHAIGAPCQPETSTHACLPAMTLIPNVQLSGILAILCSLAVLVWAVVFIERTRGSLVLAWLSVGLMLVGGGFIPPFHALIAAGAATQIKSLASWWRNRLTGRAARLLAALYPGLLLIYLAWVVIQTVFSETLNSFLLGLGFILMPIELIVVCLSVVAAFAHDLQTAAPYTAHIRSTQSLS